MNQQQIKTKIQELEDWLTENPTHNDLTQVLQMKRDYEQQLNQQQDE